MYGVALSRSCRTFVLGALVGCAHVVHDDPDAGSGGFDSAPSGGSGSGGVSNTAGKFSTGGATVVGGAPLSTTGGISIGAASTGGAGDQPPKQCEMPTPDPVGGGIVRCADYSYRRLVPAECPSLLPRPERIEYQFNTECWYDSECTAEANGYCNYGSCFYGCRNDSDCAGSAVCVCGDPVGRCIASTCRTSADCQPGYPCMAIDSSYGFFCQDPEGLCRSNIPCGVGNVCVQGVCQRGPG